MAEKHTDTMEFVPQAFYTPFCSKNGWSCLSRLSSNTWKKIPIEPPQHLTLSHQTSLKLSAGVLDHVFTGEFLPPANSRHGFVGGERRSALPSDAPVRLNALNGGILDVVEGEALLDLGAVHAHADLHRSHSRQRGGGVAHNLCHGASKRAKEELFIQHCGNFQIFLHEQASYTSTLITCMYAPSPFLSWVPCSCPPPFPNSLTEERMIEHVPPSPHHVRNTNQQLAPISHQHWRDSSTLQAYI